MVALYYITQIGCFIQTTQIVCFLFFRFKQSHLWQSSKSIVIQPSFAYISTNTTKVFVKGERPDAYLVTSASELSHNIT